ncbi:MAG: NHL repeat-containing protein [Nitrospirota bacterium]
MSRHRWGALLLLIASGGALSRLAAHGAEPPARSELTAATAHVITVAGNGLRGRADGQGELAQFNWPTGVAIGSDWTLYIADYANHLIRKVSPDGMVTTFAGSGQPGSVDGPGADARLHGPDSLVLARSGDLYVADADNRQIRKIAPDGTVTTVAGSGQPGSRDGPARAAQFGYPTGLAVDDRGTIYVADRGAHKIRKITPEGQVSTLAGNGLPGYTDGMGPAAQFHDPMTVVVDPAGRLFVADSGTHTIRAISPAGRVSTLAGSAKPGFADGAGAAAQFNWPTGLARDEAGNLYVADSNNARIRKVTPEGVVTTIAGNGQPGLEDGPGPVARFQFPTGVGVDRHGTLYIADSANHLIRRISAGLLLFTRAPDRSPDAAFGLHASGPAYYTETSRDR